MPPAGGWLARPAAYVEAHVEQGPVLDGLDAPLGVVTSIVGLARLAVTFRGRAGHAGTTPMAGRSDALVAASAFVQRAAALAAQLEGAVATVGRLTVHPGAANVIPERVELIVDARAPAETALAELLAALEAAAADAEVEVLRRTSPVTMAADVRAALVEALEELDLAAPELHSGAGHDAGVLGAAGGAERDAVRPQPERRRLPLARRALRRGRCRPVRGRARGGATTARWRSAGVSEVGTDPCGVSPRA
jgi:allantoate deiminase